NLSILTRAVGASDSRIVEINHGTDKKLPRTNLDFAEETILACLDERSTLSRLREMSHLSDHEFGRAMYSLLISGMLRVKGDTSDHADSVRTEVQQRWLSFNTIPGVKNIGREPMQRL